MENVKSQLNVAIYLLSEILVKQDDVERMAAAKQNIRKAIIDLDKLPTAHQDQLQDRSVKQ